MPHQKRQVAGDATGVPSGPTMEIRLNGLSLDIGEPAANWPGTLRQVARAMTSAAVEQTLEFGDANTATIEVWNKDGRLLVTVSANIEANWSR